MTQIPPTVVNYRCILKLVNSNNDFSFLIKSSHAIPCAALLSTPTSGHWLHGCCLNTYWIIALNLLCGKFYFKNKKSWWNDYESCYVFGMMCTCLKDVFHRFYQVGQNKNLPIERLCVEDSWCWYFVLEKPLLLFSKWIWCSTIVNYCWSFFFFFCAEYLER